VRYIYRMPARVPLSALLSQTLVAFTIELDNEFERRMPHRTTNHGSTPGAHQAPWLVSLAMWSSCMRFVGDEGVRVRDLEDLARMATNLNGMERWGYIVIEPDPADRRPKPPRSDWLIRATPRGREAREVWRPLPHAIEECWQTRFGKEEIDQLRESLRALIGQMDVELPDYLPILEYGLFSRIPDPERQAPAARADVSHLPLSALLAKMLLAFALEFERGSDLSLAISANVLRVLDEKGVRVRNLPLLTGVSKEAISMAMGILQKRRLAAVETDQAGSRTKVARLTSKGREAQDAYPTLLGTLEKRWQERFGKDAIHTLRESLERLFGSLFRGLEPYPDGWRASVRKPDTLPHYPMVLHRGGFPDGS
jgi:DNA-binding MarR family transcriptional regulator